MAQSTVSQHIKELMTAGLIETSSRKGDYTLNYHRLSEGLIALLGLLSQTNLNTMEEDKKCNCGENCTCGDNCQCEGECICRLYIRQIFLSLGPLKLICIKRITLTKKVLNDGYTVF